MALPWAPAVRPDARRRACRPGQRGSCGVVCAQGTLASSRMGCIQSSGLRVRESCLPINTQGQKRKLGACCWCTGSVLDDVALVWANCRAFNAADPGLLSICDAAEADFARRWGAAGLPTGGTSGSLGSEASS